MSATGLFVIGVLVTRIVAAALAISSNAAVHIDGARLGSGDIEASNGVIHIIDRVPLPARI